MTTKQALEAARGIISDRMRWTQGILENSDGQVCAIGAVNRALGIPQCESHYLCDENTEALRVLATVIDPDYDGEEVDDVVYAYNDGNPHECVLAAFDAAIEKAS